MTAFALSQSALKAARWAFRVAEYAVPAGLAWLEAELEDQADEPDPIEWRRFVVQATRNTPAGTVEDVAQFKLDLLNITAGVVDSSWTTADHTACHNAIYAMLQALQPYMATTHTFSRIKAYRMAFNDVADITRPFADSGAPVWNSAITLAGTGTGAQAYQVAGTVTFRTAWPRHWGRIYLPGPPTARLDAYGRFDATYRTSVDNAVTAGMTALRDADFFPVVPVGQLDKLPFHALLHVTACVVDDVPDVQRRRRPRQVLARSTV